MDVLGETGETSLVETKISKIIEAAVADLGFQLVRVLFMGGNSGRNQLQIMAEPVEDREMTVEDCKKLSRHIAALLDVEDPISSAYVLEVSSPGIDRPLTKIEDYERFEGELAKINLRMMRDGRRRFNGRLNGFDEDGKIVLETSFGRFVFAFDEIDSARIDPAEILAMPTKDGPTKDGPTKDGPTKDGPTKDRQMSNDKRG
jgi:ribosome maturation factor RimP